MQANDPNDKYLAKLATRRRFTTVTTGNCPADAPQSDPVRLFHCLSQNRVDRQRFCCAITPPKVLQTTKTVRVVGSDARTGRS